MRVPSRDVNGTKCCPNLSNYSTNAANLDNWQTLAKTAKSLPRNAQNLPKFRQN